MEYREIIKKNIQAILKKKARLKSKEKVEYWDRVIANLVADLRDYEGGERWAREPKDKLWKRHAVRLKMSDTSEIDKIFRKLLKDFFEEDDFWRFF